MFVIGLASWWYIN